MVKSSSSTTAQFEAQSLISFGGCNYLALAHHPSMLRAAQQAAEKYGLTTSASRTTTGDTDLHHELERLLTDWLPQEAALLAPEGMLANLVACQTAYASGIRHALIDQRAHQSLAVAATAAGIRFSYFTHNTTPNTTNLCQTNTPCAILTDGVFTATGEIANLAGLLESLPTKDSVLLVDDCHGFPVLANGHGSVACAGLTDPRVWITTSLAKGLGAGGGVFLAPKPAIEDASTKASAFVCTTPPSPALVGAAIEAMHLLEQEPDRISRLAANSNHAACALESIGLIPGTSRTPIFAIDLGTADPERFMSSLRSCGFTVPVMSYPGGPSSNYARLAVNTDHTFSQIDSVIAAIESAMGNA